MHAEAIQYIEALDLPDPGPRYESAGEVEIQFGEQAEAVAVGSQITEFGTAVSPAQRAAVSDCLLLAQLAANKAMANNPDMMAWYKRYVEVLQNIGWTATSMSFERRKIDEAESSVNKVVIPLLTSLLGPGAAAASIVVSVLNSLQDMDKDSPWITLFDRASQHASGAKFQLGFVDADEGAEPTVSAKLVALAIDAKRTITQVLFFKFSSQNATLSSADGRFGIGAATLEAIRPSVQEKVTPFLIDNIGKIEL
ncbi:MAG: hypothetical protein KDJ47_18890 [Hyphomicrobiaceae bacterium]|nr:hypothetical protein [Hyphomicrobiaceae bacterium]